VSPRAALLTALALICFAGNSLLCRLALADGHIDAASFTAIRLLSGAVVLVLLASRQPRSHTRAGGWTSAVVLFAYAAPFSYAYLRLGAALGALLLFAAVQVTMIGWGIARGERPNVLAWVGIVVALAGLVGLTMPGQTAPDPVGSAAMAVAGVAWGVYSLRGRATTGDPIVATASSFARALPLAAGWIGLVVCMGQPHFTARGVALASISGAVASGLGYAIWYAALPALSATRAAVLQLLVPILAAIGAVAWLGEDPSLRLVVASVAILGGVALTLVARPGAAPVSPEPLEPARRARRDQSSLRP
jgi:drug/metabolite transporter (DMT)-like permease